MDLQLIISILLTLMPLIELRGGMPVAIQYAISHNYPIWFVFILIVIVNILIIPIVFLFLDYLNKFFLKFNFYQKFFNFFLERARKKAEKVEKQMKVWGFLALAIFVGIPLPLTGAYTGCLIAWILNLDRKKSILAISAGVVIAAVLVFLASLGLFRVWLFSIKV